RDKQWPGLLLREYVLDGGKRLFPKLDSPISEEKKLQLTLGPPIPVNVRLRVEGQTVTYWVEKPTGELLPDWPVRVELTHGSRGAETVKDGKRSFTVSVTAPATVSVAELKTGVTALAEVRP